MNNINQAKSGAIMTIRDDVPIADSLLPNLRKALTSISPFLDYRHASDEDLLAAPRSSDERAFTELSTRYRKSIHKTSSRIVRHREGAEDVVQDTLFKAYVHLHHFRGICRFSSWLTRIAISSALNLLRKRRSRSEVSCDQRGDEDPTWKIWEFPDPSPNSEQTYEQLQALSLLSQALTRLPPAYRNVLTQFHDREQSVQRIADTVGITVAPAESRLRRARLNLRSTLEKSELSRWTHGIERPRVLQHARPGPRL